MLHCSSLKAQVWEISISCVSVCSLYFTWNNPQSGLWLLYILSACNAIQHLEMEGASSDWSMWVCQSGKFRLILGSIVPLSSDKLTGSFFRFWMSAWYSFPKGWVVYVMSCVVVCYMQICILMMKLVSSLLKQCEILDHSCIGLQFFFYLIEPELLRLNMLHHSKHFFLLQFSSAQLILSCAEFQLFITQAFSLVQFSFVKLFTNELQTIVCHIFQDQARTWVPWGRGCQLLCFPPN